MSNKAYYFFSILLFLFILILPQQSKVQAQQLTVKLIPPPVNQLKSADLWKVELVNPSRNEFRILINVDLKEKTSGLQAESRLKMVNITPGSKRFSFSDFNLAGITYRSTKLQEAFDKNMNAPDGNYTICVYVKNEKGVEVARDCIEQTIITIKPEAVSPQLISPANETTLNTKQPIVFTWMLPSVRPATEVTYKIKVVEIMGNQSPSDAVKRNPAWFEKDGIKGTTLMYPASANKLNEGKKYSWQVIVSGQQEAKSVAWNFSVSGDQPLLEPGPPPQPMEPVCSLTAPTYEFCVYKDDALNIPAPTYSAVGCQYYAQFYRWNSSSPSDPWTNLNPFPPYTVNTFTVGVQHIRFEARKASMCCYTECWFTVYVYPNIGAITSENPICNNDATQLTLNVSPLSGTSVHWSYQDNSGPSWDWGISNPINTNLIPTPNNNLCPGNSWTRTYTAFVNPAQWGLPATPPSGCSIVSTATFPITVYCPTTATLNITSSTHTDQTGSYTINNGDKICSDNNHDGNPNYPVNLTLTAGGNGQIISWAVTGPSCATPISGTSSVVNYNITCAGTYQFTVTRQNGLDDGLCGPQHAQVTVKVVDPLTPPTITVIEHNGVPVQNYSCPFTVCPHDDATLTIGSSYSGALIRWYYWENYSGTNCPPYPPLGMWKTAGTGYEQNTNSIGPLNVSWQNVWWMVTVQDPDQVCDPVRACCQINIIKPLCIPTISIAGPIPKCPGESININVLPQPPLPPNCGPVTSYEWFLDGESIGSGSSYPTALSTAQPGNYYLVVHGPCEGSVKSNTVTVKDRNITVFIKGPCCAGPIILQAVGTNDCPPNPPVSYQWYLNGVPITGATQSQITVNPPGPAPMTYQYTVSYTACGCTVFSAIHWVKVCN